MCACNFHNEGVTADPNALSYPIALALSREPLGPDPLDGPDYLYIANTNYDLRYNGGSVQSFNLNHLDLELAKNRCRSMDVLAVQWDASVEFADNTIYANASWPLDAGAPDAGDDAGLEDSGVADAGQLGGMDASVITLPADYNVTSRYGTRRGILCDKRDPIGDGRTPDGMGGDNPDCCFGTVNELTKIVSGQKPIDSYAVGIAVSPDNTRLYVPVASRSKLLYLDLDGQGGISCGADDGRCKRGPGLHSQDDVPNGSFPGQPANMVIGTMAELGVDTSPGQDIRPDSVFIATAHELGGFGLFVEKNGAPVLEDAAQGLPERPSSLTLDPVHHLLYVTANKVPYFSRLGVRIAATNSVGNKEPGPRELLYETSRVFVNNVLHGSKYGVAQANDLRDIRQDPNDPNRLYALLRGTQESVVFMELDPTAETAEARVVDAVRVGAGPSKLTLVEQDGKTFVLASCYDGRNIFVIDTETHKLVAVVRNLSGPFEMVHDPRRRLLYVSDFRVSVLRVIDVAGLTQPWEPPPRIVATIGNPEFEGGLN